ncbi:hypothetical protein BV20DRAFT_346271 [Pilatotrama ljubarskyi]|nr:hypothetical protein BV20DRAFT_346271 [Pilatotrama ljubarskyi]
MKLRRLWAGRGVTSTVGAYPYVVRLRLLPLSRECAWASSRFFKSMSLRFATMTYLFLVVLTLQFVPGSKQLAALRSAPCTPHIISSFMEAGIHSQPPSRHPVRIHRASD